MKLMILVLKLFYLIDFGLRLNVINVNDDKKKLIKNKQSNWTVNQSKLSRSKLVWSK